MNESFVIKAFVQFQIPRTKAIVLLDLEAWRRSSLNMCWCHWVCWCTWHTIYGLSIPLYATLFELSLALMLSLVISGFFSWWVWVLYTITFSLSLSLPIHNNNNMLSIHGLKMWQFFQNSCFFWIKFMMS